MRHLISRSAALAGAFLMLDVEGAVASAFMARENSANAVAMVSAGSASRAEDASTVFGNPAGMSFLEGSQIEVGASVVLPDLNFVGNATVLGTPISGVNDRSVGQIAMIPHVYGAFQIDDRLSAGIAVTVPFGLNIDYSENWPGRYVNIKTSALSIDVNPNVSYKITDRVSVAAGVSAQYFKVQFASAIAQFLIFGPGTQDGGYLLTADDIAWGFNLGMLAQVTDATRIGLTYRSAITHEIEGDLHLWPTTSPLLGLASAPATAGIDLPASTTLGLTHQVTPDFSISADVQFTQWHVFRRFTVNSPPNPLLSLVSGFRDSWMVSLGGVYRLDSRWTLRGGVGFDQTPVTDGYRFPGIPDANRYMVGIGAGYNFTNTMGLDFGYAHYFTADHGTLNSSVNAVDPFTGVTLHGQYNNALDYLSISFRSAI
jgi:long-chain fatty acid transport protein